MFRTRSGIIDPKGVRALSKDGVPEDDEGALTIEKIKAKRKENFMKFDKVITQYEQQLQQNPNEAEESFDRSVSMKRFRVTSEMLMSSSMKNSARNLLAQKSGK